MHNEKTSYSDYHRKYSNSTDSHCNDIKFVNSRDDEISQKDNNTNGNGITSNHPDDNDDDSNSIASGNMSNSVPPLSYPSLYAEIMASHNLHDDEHVKLMTSQNWLTESLQCEINNHSPTNDDIIFDKATQ